jgi:hypothetical protein
MKLFHFILENRKGKLVQVKTRSLRLIRAMQHKGFTIVKAGRSVSRFPPRQGGSNLPGVPSRWQDWR